MNKKNKIEILLYLLLLALYKTDSNNNYTSLKQNGSISSMGVTFH